MLVSHDREFLDNVVTSTLVFEGDGRVGEYVGGYSDWLRQTAQPGAAQGRGGRKTGRLRHRGRCRCKRKLTYKEGRELEQLPARIEQLETELASLTARLHDPAFYQQGGPAIVAANQEISARQAELDSAYSRWQELEAVS